MPRGGCYVDNAYNRRVGRVGMPMGSCVISKNSPASFSSFSTPVFQKTYEDSFSSYRTPSKTYTDNAFNRSLDRVGLEIGMAVHSRDDGSVTEQFYVDNAKNRSLGRVDLPRGSRPESKCDDKVRTPVFRAWEKEEKPQTGSLRTHFISKYEDESSYDRSTLKAREKPVRSAEQVYKSEREIKKEPVERSESKASWKKSDNPRPRSAAKEIQEFIDDLEKQLNATKARLLLLEQENKKLQRNQESIKRTEKELADTKATAAFIEEENRKLINSNQSLKSENKVLKAKLRKASSPATSEKICGDIGTIMEEISFMKQLLSDLPTEADRCLNILHNMKGYFEDRGTTH